MALPHMTNDKLVDNMMNFSKFGALSQMFVMAALNHYADHVIEEGPKMKKDVDITGRVSLINLDSWIGVAKEIKQKLDDNVKNF